MIVYPDNYGGAMIAGYKDEPQRFNSILTRSTIAHTINRGIYDGLITLTPSGKIQPRIARKWDVLDNGSRWRFFLNKNVYFHNDMKCTCRDVKFTYELALSQARKFSVTTTLDDLMEIKCIDDYTVDFLFSKPSTSFLMILYFVGVMPEKLWKGKNIEKNIYNYKPVGTGPYVFKKWESNKEIVIESNKRYFRPRYYIDKVIARKYDDLQTLWTKLETGEIDLMYNEILPDDFERIKKNPRLKTFTLPDYYNYVLVFNFKKKIFKNPKIRKVFDLAINKEEIVEKILKGYGTVSAGIYPMSMLDLSKEEAKQDFNPKQAYKMMIDEGWKDEDENGIFERNGKDFKVEVLIDEGNILKERAFLLIQQQLRYVGIDSYATLLSLPEIYARIAMGNFDLIFVNKSIILDLPIWHWHSSSIGKGDNFGRYSNPKLDYLLEAQSTEQDREAKIALRKQAQALVADDLPCIFLFFKEILGAINARFERVDKAKDAFLWENQYLYIPKDKRKY